MTLPETMTFPETSPLRRSAALLTVCLGMMVTFLTITETLATLTPMQDQMHATAADVVWVASLYTVVVACLVLTSATVGDMIGRRTVFTAGVVVLAVGALLVVLAATTTTVIIGQAVMGLGGAMVLPNSLAIVTHLFPEPHERTGAVGIWTSVSGVGLALGPIISGLLLQTFSWHSTFIVNIALAVVVVVLTAAFVPDSRQAGRRLDPAGLVLGITAIGSLTYAVIQGSNEGYGHLGISGLFVLSVAAAIAFVVVEQRSATPMLHLRLFRHPAFSIANAAVFVAQFAFVGIAFVHFLYFEQVDHFSILSTGVRLLSFTGTYVLVAAATGRLVRRIGFRVVISVGLAAAGAGALLLLHEGPATSFPVVALSLALFAAGSGLVLPSSTAAAIQTVPPHQAGMASGAVNMFRQSGGALGAAIMGTVLISGFLSRLPAALISRGVPAGIAHRITVGAANGGTVSSLPVALRGPATGAVASSFAQALHTAVVIPGVAALAVAALAGMFLRSRPPAAPDAPGNAARPVDLAPPIDVADPVGVAALAAAGPLANEVPGEFAAAVLAVRSRA